MLASVNDDATRPERPVRWVRAPQAADYLDIGVSTLYRLRKQRQLPEAASRKLSHRLVLWDLDVLDRFLANRPAVEADSANPTDVGSASDIESGPADDLAQLSNQAPEK